MPTAPDGPEWLILDAVRQRVEALELADPLPVYVRRFPALAEGEPKPVVLVCPRDQSLAEDVGFGGEVKVWDYRLVVCYTQAVGWKNVEGLRETLNGRRMIRDAVLDPDWFGTILGVTRVDAESVEELDERLSREAGVEWASLGFVFRVQETSDVEV